MSSTIEQQYDNLADDAARTASASAAPTTVQNINISRISKDAFANEQDFLAYWQEDQNRENECVALTHEIEDFEAELERVTMQAPAEPDDIVKELATMIEGMAIRSPELVGALEERGIISAPVKDVHSKLEDLQWQAASIRVGQEAMSQILEDTRVPSTMRDQESAPLEQDPNTRKVNMAMHLLSLTHVESVEISDLLNADMQTLMEYLSQDRYQVDSIKLVQWMRWDIEGKVYSTENPKDIQLCDLRDFLRLVHTRSKLTYTWFFSKIQALYSTGIDEKMWNRILCAIEIGMNRVYRLYTPDQIDRPFLFFCLRVSELLWLCKRTHAAELAIQGVVGRLNIGPWQETIASSFLLSGMYRYMTALTTGARLEGPQTILLDEGRKKSLLALHISQKHHLIACDGNLLLLSQPALRSKVIVVEASKCAIEMDEEWKGLFCVEEYGIRENISRPLQHWCALHFATASEEIRT